SPSLSTDTQDSKQDASGSSHASSAAGHIGSATSSDNLRDHGSLTHHNLESSADIETSALRLASTSPLRLLHLGTTTRSTATSPHGTLPRRPTSCPTSIHSTIFTLGESVANNVPPPGVSPKSEPAAGTSSLYETLLLALEGELSASPSPPLHHDDTNLKREDTRGSVTPHTPPSPTAETQNMPAHNVCNSPRGPERLRIARSSPAMASPTIRSHERLLAGRNAVSTVPSISTPVPCTVSTPSPTATAGISHQFQVVGRVTSITAALQDASPDDTARDEPRTNPSYHHAGNALNPFATPQRPINSHPSLSNVSRDRLLRSSRHDLSKSEQRQRTGYKLRRDKTDT
ncbi:unnamed protein product, partial [Ectocarpus sp. 6 AP-2014]